jgi:hypothetical protein
MKILILIFIVTSSLFCAPAFSKIRTFKNSDGKEFKAQAQGDQYLNWIYTEDGEILKYNQKSKDFEYAIIKDNLLQPSGVKYQKKSTKTKMANSFKKVDISKIYKLWQEKRKTSPLNRH